MLLLLLLLLPLPRSAVPSVAPVTRHLLTPSVTSSSETTVALVVNALTATILLLLLPSGVRPV